MKRVGISSCILKAVLAMFAAAVLLTTIAQAQVDTGSIIGTVTDPSGAVVSGAKVTLTNVGTGTALSTTTGSDGVYKFSPVRIGSYKLDASAQGFKTVSQTDVRVDVGASVVANFTLTPGSTSEMVEVTAAAPVLQTQDASLGQVMNQQDVNNLPLNGRNFTFLAQLVAGVNSPQADTRGNAASGAFAANGLRPAQNNYMLDGIDNNSDTVDFLNGTNYVVLPPVDAIQEFKVQTSDFSAEFGRSGAAVLNATIKSGTNQFHGNVWEFFRNDKLDAADYFERTLTNGGWHTTKGELRQNQYGFTIGGPVLIPHVFDGRNKVFFFGDYEGFRRRQGVPHNGSVPTLQERGSGATAFTNFQELITDQSGTQTDALGRIMPTGTILDPSTTRPAGSGFVRDPFTAACANEPAGFTYTLAACPDLNILPAGRLDQNAISLLNLYPLPTGPGISGNFSNSPNLKEDRQSFDTRLDLNLSTKDQVFFRFSLVDDPQLIPAIFGGVADGGGFQEGNQTALSQQSALVWTHTFSPTLVNVARAGLNYLHTTRVSPEANNLTGASGSGIPADFGIQAIPQQHENGGLPAFGIQGLATLGSNAFLPSDEVSSTIQLTDDLTKIYGKHTFKMGFEAQHVKFSTLQPPWSRGQFNFDGVYTNIPGASDSTENTGIAQFLLTPTVATGLGTVDYLGGPGHENPASNNSVFVSNISLTDNGKNYYGSYFQDDWKVSQKLTLNLGLRWDFFGLVYEHHGQQANFVPGGSPTGAPLYLIPPGTDLSNLTNFTTLLVADGITPLVTGKYGKGLGKSQKTNFAPRFGFAYQVTPKLVARGGFGIFYNGFENRGFSPNLGENYPFQFNFQFHQPDDNHPLTYNGCTATGAGPVGNATLETGFACTPLDPASPLFVATGLALRGIQFDYTTPYSMSGNFTLQYQLTPTMSLQAGYVTSLGRHLEVFPNSNNVTAIIPAGVTLSTLTPAQGGLPFPDFGQGSSYAITEGSSYYHGLQTKVEKQFGNGLNFLAAYTWSKVRSDAYDLLNGFSAGGYRAPDVPGFGIHGDYGLANFDIRNVFHFSGGYQLPFGKGKRFMTGDGVAGAIAGGWSLIWSTTLQGGQPINFSCPTAVSTGTNCLAYVLPGTNPRTDLHLSPDGHPIMLNSAAFAQPCVIGTAGCNPANPVLALGGQPSQVAAPGFHRLDLSAFKDFQLSERFRLQFRSEFFNILNHPNFNAPGFGGNGVVAISGSANFTSSTFGQIGSTRDAPYDPRQIQLALKLYF